MSKNLKGLENRKCLHPRNNLINFNEIFGNPLNNLIDFNEIFGNSLNNLIDFNEIFWDLLNNLVDFNEIFGKNVTYNNLNNHAKPELDHLCEKHIFRKTIGFEGVNWTSLRWLSAAIVNFEFENNILFKKEIQTYLKILKHLSF